MPKSTGSRGEAKTEPGHEGLQVLAKGFVRQVLGFRAGEIGVICLSE